MKLISSLQGSYAIQFSGDDAAPKTAFLMRDLTTAVADAYDFALRPEATPTLATEPFQIFQSGSILLDKTKVAIKQFVMAGDGWVISSRDTETAEIIGNHLVAFFNSKFGFKIAENIREKHYLSFLIVEFEPGLERQMSVMGRIKAVLEREIPRATPFDVKRLAFGSAEKQVVAAMQSVEGFKVSDFAIDRRAGELQSSNRYFCSAPLSTTEHVRVLNLVEEAMRD